MTEDKRSNTVLCDVLSDAQTVEFFRLALALIRKRQLTLSPPNYAPYLHSSAGLDQA
jgi:hypothetical protein